jgi:hypothetical protein
MIALSLGRCKPFLTLPSCDFRVSIATGPGTLQVQPRPQCPESDGRPSKWHPSLWGQERPLRRAACVRAHVANSEVAGNLPESQCAFNLRAT